MPAVWKADPCPTGLRPTKRAALRGWQPGRRWATWVTHCPVALEGGAVCDGVKGWLHVPLEHCEMGGCMHFGGDCV